MATTSGISQINSVCILLKGFWFHARYKQIRAIDDINSEVLAMVSKNLLTHKARPKLKQLRAKKLVLNGQYMFGQSAR